jgi:hypothetical protein
LPMASAPIAKNPTAVAAMAAPIRATAISADALVVFPCLMQVIVERAQDAIAQSSVKSR